MNDNIKQLTAARLRERLSYDSATGSEQIIKALRELVRTHDEAWLREDTDAWTTHHSLQRQAWEAAQAALTAYDGQTPSPERDERAAFETWALRAIANMPDLERRGQLTGYKSSELNQAWVGWQARAAASPEQGAEPVAWISFCVPTQKAHYGKLPIQSMQPGAYKHTPLYTAPPKEET